MMVGVVAAGLRLSGAPMPEHCAKYCGRTRLERYRVDSLLAHPTSLLVWHPPERYQPARIALE